MHPILAVSAGAAFLAASEPAAVSLGPTIRPVEPRMLGINVNYWVDDDRNRPPGSRTLVEALRDMGVRFLRYPGGEKSDSCLWSIPPFTAPLPTLARTGPLEWPSCSSYLMQEDGRTFRTTPMDFDAFMAVCRACEAEPILVVCHDAAYRPPTAGGTGPTADQLIETAAAWVRYANQTRAYGVKYWEIGNESYIDEFGCTAATYGDSLLRFATAMKAVDPTISILACGPNGGEPGKCDAIANTKDPWWQTVFARAGSAIDGISLHSYPCWKWGRFETYRKRWDTLAHDVDRAIAAVETAAPAERHGSLTYFVTEYNAADWSAGPDNPDGWPMRNDLGHALVDVDLIGTYLSHPRLSGAALWNTRYPHEKSDPLQLWDALTPDNHLMGTGQVLALWKRVLGTSMIATSGGDPALRIFASRHADGRCGLMLINPEEAAIAVRLPGPIAAGWTLSGANATDTNVRTSELIAGGIEVQLPPWSATGVIVTPR